jgi:hypothetical protein
MCFGRGGTCARPRVWLRSGLCCGFGYTDSLGDSCVYPCLPFVMLAPILDAHEGRGGHSIYQHENRLVEWMQLAGWLCIRQFQVLSTGSLRDTLHLEHSRRTGWARNLSGGQSPRFVALFVVGSSSRAAPIPLISGPLSALSCWSSSVDLRVFDSDRDLLRLSGLSKMGTIEFAFRWSPPRRFPTSMDVGCLGGPWVLCRDFANLRVTLSKALTKVGNQEHLVELPNSDVDGMSSLLRLLVVTRGRCCSSIDGVRLSSQVLLPPAPAPW